MFLKRQLDDLRFPQEYKKRLLETITTLEESNKTPRETMIDFDGDIVINPRF